METVVKVSDEDELQLVLDRLDPEIFLLSPAEHGDRDPLGQVSRSPGRAGREVGGGGSRDRHSGLVSEEQSAPVSTRSSSTRCRGRLCGSEPVTSSPRRKTGCRRRLPASWSSPPSRPRSGWTASATGCRSRCSTRTRRASCRARRRSASARSSTRGVGTTTPASSSTSFRRSRRSSTTRRTSPERLVVAALGVAGVLAAVWLGRCLRRGRGVEWQARRRQSRRHTWRTPTWQWPTCH